MSGREKHAGDGLGHGEADLALRGERQPHELGGDAEEQGSDAGGHDKAAPTQGRGFPRSGGNAAGHACRGRAHREGVRFC